jgi:DNA-binding GntR family transcriptional regulator
MTAPPIARLDHVSLREHAYAALRDAFIRGAFAPGDTVSLRMLADQLGISLTPVREAVRRLVAEGALVDTPSRTLAVPPFDAARARDLKRARLALEGLVLEQAMARIDADGIAALEAVIAREAGDGPDLQANYDFHFGLYRHSGSAVLMPLVEGLWVQYGAYLNRIIATPAARKLPEHKHHRKILAALRKGDREAAQAALARDIERSFRVILPGEEEGE